MGDQEDLTAYYFGFDNVNGQAGMDYWENKTRLFISEQLRYTCLEEWCFDLDWVGC